MIERQNNKSQKLLAELLKTTFSMLEENIGVRKMYSLTLDGVFSLFGSKRNMSIL